MALFNFKQNLSPEDDVIAKSNEALCYSVTILTYVFKNLIGGALHTWPKTDFVPSFESTNNEFLKECN